MRKPKNRTELNWAFYLQIKNANTTKTPKSNRTK